MVVVASVVALDDSVRVFAPRPTRLNCLCVRPDLPAGTTAAILPLLDCQRTVRDLYDTLKTRHNFIQEVISLYVASPATHPRCRYLLMLLCWNTYTGVCTAHVWIRYIGSLNVDVPMCLQLGWAGFKQEVTAFYHGLSTHASSRQVFLSTEPFVLEPPKKRRDFKKVTFK